MALDGATSVGKLGQQSAGRVLNRTIATTHIVRALRCFYSGLLRARAARPYVPR